MGGMTSDLVRFDPPLRAWRLTRRQWFLAVLVFLGIALAFASYVLLNAAPPPDRWPAFFATDPSTGELVQPLAGDEPYQTFVLKSWLDERIPFVPLLAIPYLSFLLIVPIVVPLLNLAVGSFRRFLTVGLALIVSQVVLDAAFVLFQTNVIRDVEAGDGLAGDLVRVVWGNDQPFNGYPSGHCAWTTIALRYLWRLRHRLVKTSWILMPWLLLVFPATVMLRQHYLMDVYAGIAVGFACYWAFMFIVERPRLVPSNEGPLIAPQPVVPQPMPVEQVAEVVPVPWGAEDPAEYVVPDVTPVPVDHRAKAVATYNRCWDLLDNPTRSADEDAELLTAAFASRYHWLAVDDEQAHIIAEWMVSRAAAAVGEPDIAILFGRRALAAVITGERPAWLRASIYEGLARAYASAGDGTRRDECIARAWVELEAEQDVEDRQAIADQIEDVPQVPAT